MAKATEASAGVSAFDIETHQVGGAASRAASAAAASVAAAVAAAVACGASLIEVALIAQRSAALHSVVQRRRRRGRRGGKPSVSSASTDDAQASVPSYSTATS